MAMRVPHNVVNINRTLYTEEGLERILTLASSTGTAFEFDLSGWSRKDEFSVRHTYGQVKDYWIEKWCDSHKMRVTRITQDGTTYLQPDPDRKWVYYDE